MEVISSSVERKVFGMYETIAVPVNDLVRLPQVRSGSNPDLPDLKESIKTNGLLNPIDIAVMDEATLQEYIDFINELWGKNVQLDDYSDLRQPDGTYYLVIAGHTRAEAISQLQIEDQTDCQYDVMCKIHSANDPYTIISLQLDENIHSKPSPERRAIAIVEAWQYGLRKGSWKNKAEFLRLAGKKFNAKNVSDAIAFSQLPQEVRDFVFEGNASYASSVELGKSVETVKDYVNMKLSVTKPEDDVDGLVENAYKMRLGAIIQYVFSRGLGVGASINYIKSQVAAMEQALGRAVSQPEMGLFSQAEQYRMGYEDIKKQYLNSVQETNLLALERRKKQLDLQYKLAKVAELLLIIEQTSSEELVEHLAA